MRCRNVDADAGLAGGERGDLGILRVVVRLQHDEAAAHRVIGALEDDVAVLAGGRDRQRVHVIGQDRAWDEADVLGDVQGNARTARQCERARARQRRQNRLHRVDIHRLRVVTRQTQEDSAVR